MNNEEYLFIISRFFNYINCLDLVNYLYVYLVSYYGFGARVLMININI